MDLSIGTTACLAGPISDLVVKPMAPRPAPDTYGTDQSYVSDFWGLKIRIR